MIIKQGGCNMPRKNNRYGWIPDLPDIRDYLYTAPFGLLGILPPSLDLTSACPPIYDQGQLASSTVNAVAAALEFDQIKQQLAQIFMPSRLFIYYNVRNIQGTIDADNGSMIRDALKSISEFGAPPEDIWPYNTSSLTYTPPAISYQAALQHKPVLYQSIPRDLYQMKGCLATGYPFIFGFSVYESFESQQVAQEGHIPMPQHGEQLIGGHAVLAVGYDDANQWFIVRNSWGTGWGMQGYFTIPYLYVIHEKLSSDFWTVRIVQ
jgi:C1A family cysteine protease